jgi:hypothetical protein
MLRQVFVLVGLAVLLSLLFPVQPLLDGSGAARYAARLPVLDIAALAALLAIAPAAYLFRDARLAHRLPRWTPWLVLLALCSLLFLLLHMHWSRELATVHARDLLEAGGLGALSPQRFVSGLELAARLGVLVSAVGVLTRLEAAPEDGAPQPPRKYVEEAPRKRRSSSRRRSAAK